ncbi:MAG: matrixin family metalloprotease [bacterium]|nr:matrixin family metalloprotease [bacterium]
MGALHKAGALVLIGAVAYGHVRLTNSGTGNALFWDDSTGIEIVVNSDGSDDLPGGSHETALRNSIAAWNDVTQVDASFDEEKAAGQQSRNDWQSDSLHLMLFDETNSSGFFPGGSGVVAVTPIEFFLSGRIIDADVLFNGMDFQFTTSAEAGRYDVQDVATHELGHFLGLDHSGWAGATMYPYVDPLVVLHRSLSLDDVHGLRHAYPASGLGSIRGTIVRASGGVAIPGAHLVVRDANGRTAGAALAKSDGLFRIRSLEPGTYELYASPLDEPVSSGNLGAGHTVQTNFQSTVFGSFTVTGSSILDIGTVAADDDVTLGLGRAGDPFPLRAIDGQTTLMRISGNGLVAGSTLTASDPALTIAPMGWFGTFVDFNVTVPPGAQPGHVDLMVVAPGSERSILSAGIEITPPDPQVTSAVPSSGAVDGGASVTITGTGFRSDARVVIGDRVYADGGSCSVVNSTTITLTTGSAIGGLHDVVVIDPSGVEGRLDDGFLIMDTPVIDTVFPVAGTNGGGTLVVIKGDGFAVGATVRIDGVAQSAVAFEGSGRLEVVTDAGVAGGPYVLEVVNPGPASAQSAFAFASRSDPVALSVAPNKGTSEGGRTVTITGTGFTNQTTVVFGASAGTGTGGKLAQSVTFIDATTLSVVTPASSSSSRNVMVREADTGQATVTSGVYRFTGSDSGGGLSGGACGSLVVPGPPTWRGFLGGGSWVLLAWLLLFWRSRAARNQALATS